mmetsp:Transcript_22261/g.32326  ORF Transcript_22261/g.32326 Transcript_22261/m.32326 type:complete len:289 (-) Transcript_22261:141-1007(-)
MSMLAPVLPGPFVHHSVAVDEAPLAVELEVLPLSLVHGAVRVHHAPATVGHAVAPLPLVGPALKLIAKLATLWNSIEVYLRTHTLLPGAHVHRSIRIHILALAPHHALLPGPLIVLRSSSSHFRVEVVRTHTVAHTLLPVPYVALADRSPGVRPISMHLAVAKLPLVNIAIEVVVLARSIHLAQVPFPFVFVVVLEDEGPLAVALAVLPVALIYALAIWEDKSLVPISRRGKIWYTIGPRALQRFARNVQRALPVHHVVLPLALVHLAPREGAPSCSMPLASHKVSIV